MQCHLKVLYLEDYCSLAINTVSTLSNDKYFNKLHI